MSIESVLEEMPLGEVARILRNDVKNDDKNMAAMIADDIETRRRQSKRVQREALAKAA